MPYFGIPRLSLQESNSQKEWPDIWTDGYSIWVTQEWAKQKMHERRKRLTHEMAHMVGVQHGFHKGMVYSTLPFQDNWSWWVYWNIFMGRKRFNRRKFV